MIKIEICNFESKFYEKKIPYVSHEKSGKKYF